MDLYTSHPVLLWFIAGILLILSEFAIPGFIICFFGVAALIVAALLYFIPCMTLTVQLLVFVVIGILLLIGCRKFMPKAFRGTKDDVERDIDSDDVVDADCICIAEISPSAAGKVEFRGSSWNAVSENSIAVGEHCTVLSRNNLTLKVAKKQ